MNKIKWHGDINYYLDEVYVKTEGSVSYGCFGGARESGQYTNEDGLYILSKDNEYVLSILLDSHTTNESARLVLDEIEKREDKLKEYLELPLKESMTNIGKLFHELIHDKSFIEKTKSVKGETAFLAVLQKDKYLWWLSVGDNSLYLLHPEYSELGQERLNQRVFYQWLGEKNSIDLDIPCFTQGTIELRKGNNTVVLLTDGVLECEGQLYDNPKEVYDVFTNHTNHASIEHILKNVQSVLGRDSATIISWNVDNKSDALRPSRL